MTKTSIEWVRGNDGAEGMSWNALRAVRIDTGKSANHCEHVNEACRFCYADRMNPRLGGLPFKPGHRKDYRFVVDEKKLTEPLRRRKPTRIFVESMSDAFGKWWPDALIDKLYAVMALSPQHTYINLSKRPERRREYLDDADTFNRITHLVEMSCTVEHEVVVRRWPLPNVIEGTSVSNQEEADEFIPILLRTQAAMRAVSCEPLLGAIDLTQIDDAAAHREVPRKEWGSVDSDDSPPALWWDALSGKRTIMHGGRDGEWSREDARLDWVICGGESGPKARPMHPDWARSLRDQCKAAGVAFHFKQWGEHWPSTFIERGSDGESWRTKPDGSRHWYFDEFGADDVPTFRMSRIGKKAAGRLLDGVEHNGFPTAAPAA